MKKMRLLAGLILATAVTTVAGCGGPTGEVAQGVTDTKILIGNTATTTGLLSFVGLPFKAGMEAAMEVFNAAGGVGGRTVEYKHYDDGFLAATGMANTEKLVEDDKVFALVGHFGTPTVGATIDYIQDKGIPMVYAATGINQLYFQRTPGNPVMAVQPIYKTEGRILLARALYETDLFGTVDKVGVIYTADDAGNSIKAGIDVEALALGKSDIIVSQVGSGDYSAAVLKMKTEGVDVVIMAMNQYAFPVALTAMATNEVDIPVLTSYVSAAPASIPTAAVGGNRQVYTNAWVDVDFTATTGEYADYVAAINAHPTLTTQQKTAYAIDAFAIAGYVAFKVFEEGLRRVDANKAVLNWENYIAAMEEDVIDFALGGEIDFTDGKRWGVDTLSLLKFDATTETLSKVKEVESLNQIKGI